MKLDLQKYGLKKDQFYVYLHIYPKDHWRYANLPFYVGKGKGDRVYHRTQRNRRHQIILNKYNFNRIQIHVIPVDDQDQAFSLEAELIHLLRELEGYELVNETNGGEGGKGYKPTLEQRKKRSLSMKGRKLTPQCYIAALSSEANSKRSKALSGKSFDHCYFKKLNPTRKGIKLTEAHAQKIGAAHKGTIKSREEVERRVITYKKTCIKRKNKKHMENLILIYLSQDTEYRPRGPHAVAA